MSKRRRVTQVIFKSITHMLVRSPVGCWQLSVAINSSRRNTRQCLSCTYKAFWMDESIKGRDTKGFCDRRTSDVSQGDDPILHSSVPVSCTHAAHHRQANIHEAPSKESSSGSNVRPCSVARRADKKIPKNSSSLQRL